MIPELLEVFVAGFFSVFVWPTLGYMLLGIALGTVVGVLPGIGGVVALTLLLPFTFFLDPTAAFTLLLSTMTVIHNSSDITSILFGVPGDAASSALILDGYPMAKKGEAGRALSANLVASLVGAAIGAFAIVLAIPIVRPVVLAFGSPEFFLLTLLGISFVGVLSGESKLKGLISGALGLLISTVGLDPQSAIPRYIFGRLEFWEGVGLVPAVLGMFAVAEMYSLAVRHKSIAGVPAGKLVGVWVGIMDVFRHRWLVIRCSLIGTFIGILPALGAPVSQWIAYGHAVQSSPNRERFGKGAPEGALGPGAANNSGLGGSLIPTLAFGIPGSLPMAIILGAFLIQGLVPGPDMITKHLDLTMTFVWVIVISNVILVSALIPILGLVAKITLLPTTVLVPIMTILVYVGAFAARNSMTDVIVALVAGFVGITMVRLDWPRAPLLLGLVLGRLSERYLFISIRRYGLAFVQRPLFLVLLAILLAVLFLGVLVDKLKRLGRNQRAFESDEVQVPDPAEAGKESLPGPAGEERVEGVATDTVTSQEERGVARLDFNSLAAAVALSVGALAIWQARGWSITASLMPRTIASVVVGLSALYLLSQVRGWNKEPRHALLTDADLEEHEDVLGLRRRSATALGWLVGSLAILWLFGFLWGAPILTLAYVAGLARERWLTTGMTTAVTILIMQLFTQLLRLPLPRGVLPALFF